jgi:hypothetical protein
MPIYALMCVWGGRRYCALTARYIEVILVILVGGEINAISFYQVRLIYLIQTVFCFFKDVLLLLVMSIGRN